MSWYIQKHILLVFVVDSTGKSLMYLQYIAEIQLIKKIPLKPFICSIFPTHRKFGIELY